MPSKPLRTDLIDSFLLSMAIRDIFLPPENLEEYTLNLQKDLEINEDDTKHRQLVEELWVSQHY